jgi:phosphoribosyl 1,2-cyclic phosphodiesterase
MKRDIYHDDLKYWADKLEENREKYGDAVNALYRSDYLTEGETIKKVLTLAEVLELRNAFSSYVALSAHMSKAVKDDEKWKNRFKFWKKL